MCSKYTKNEEPVTCQALFAEREVLSAENRALKAEVQSLRARLEEAEKFRHVLNKGDLLERKRAEERLSFERAQLLSIFDGIEDMVYVADPHTYEVLYANKAMKEKLGSELVGGICYQEFQRRDSPCDFCTNPIILKERDKPYIWEHYNPTLDRHFMIMDRIIKWPDGRDMRIGIAKDITERKLLEERTRQRVEEIETLMDVVPVGIWIGHDPECQSITGNKMGNEIYEAEDKENVSATITHMRRYFYQGRELTASELPMQAAALKDIEIRDSEFDVLLPSGKRLTFIGSASPLHDSKGNVRGSVGAFMDITEQKAAETKFRATLENLDKLVKARTSELEKAYVSLKESEARLAEAQKLAHVGCYDWNIETNEEYWSDELYRIFGFDPQIKLDHNIFLKYIHPDDLEYVAYSINEALNKKPYFIDYRIILPDGAERVIYSQGGAIFDEKNRPIRMRGIVQDITERKQAEETLAKIEMTRKKEIHHRIKNNLQIISSLLDLQAEKFKDRQNIKDSEVIEAFRESQDRVISMALIHEELYKGGIHEKLNFAQYTRELAENLLQTYSLGNNNIRLKLDLAENILLDMDIAVPLGMIVNELVTNSFKHAFPGRNEGEIRIELHREENGAQIDIVNEDSKNANFNLTISDNGVGIPENINIEDLDTLGMQLITSLIEQLDGELELKKGNGSGSEFCIRFTVKAGNYQH